MKLSGQSRADINKIKTEHRMSTRQHGASAFHGENLITKSLAISLHGASTHDIKSGNAEKTDAQTHGNSELNFGEFMPGDLTQSTGGSSNIEFK